jgi:hypothetical protein
VPASRAGLVSKIAVLTIVAGFALLPAAAGAAASGSFDDPIGDVTQFAPDLGATTVTVGDDDTITVDTRIVPRPPAFWGGCAYYVGFPPFQTCVPSNMNVTWYFDYAGNGGSVADGGADAKVVVVPSRGQTFWESSRWDAANGRFSAGAQPAGAEDPGGIVWVLRLADLGIPEPATLKAWVVSLYKSYNGLGELLNYSDTAGPGTVSIPGPPPAPGSGTSKSCRQAIGKANNLQRAIGKAKRRVRNGGGKSAREELARLRAKRKRALKAMKRRCSARIDSGGPPPSSAPPGCRLVTKPVLQQEGIGIYAEWVIKPEVVVECEK